MTQTERFSALRVCHGRPSKADLEQGTVMQGLRSVGLPHCSVAKTRQHCEVSRTNFSAGEFRSDKYETSEG
eukprot:2493868-Amphidinium_carterae.1